MDLIAGPKCKYRGRAIPKGARFSVPRQYARTLIAIGAARAAPETAPRTYATRAITAPCTVAMQVAKRPVDRTSGSSAPIADAAPPVDDDLKAMRSQFSAILAGLKPAKKR